MRSVRFLYWNTDEKTATQEEVLTYVFEAGPPPDVLLLGECPVGLSAGFLQQHGLAQMPYVLLPGEIPTQQVYFRPQAGLQVQHLTTESEPAGPPEPGVGPAAAFLATNPKITARAVLLRLDVAGEATLLASVHLTSKRGGHLDETSQIDVASHYKTFIAQAGGRKLSLFGQRIAIVGDFNMNPFDAGMLQPRGFYAPNSRAFVRHTRRFNYVPELMFYNPCWALLSDVDPARPRQLRPPGSHYYAGAPSKKLYWHLYDQVILSNSLLDRLEAAELRVARYTPLEQEAEQRLNPRGYSDHLPLCFTLNLGTP